MAVKSIPDGYHSVTPYLVVANAAQLIEFLEQAFDGTTGCRLTRAGVVSHAEVRIGDSIVMIGQARGASKPIPAALYLYVGDTDAAYRRALQAGATSLMEPADQYYGDRNAGVRDLAGNSWWLATHIEDVSPEEIQRRQDALGKK